MTLENKLSRRGFLGTALAGLTGYLTADNSYADEDKKPKYELPSLPGMPSKYNFEDFQKNYEVYTCSKLEGKGLTKTRERWEKGYDNYTKNILTEVFADPKEYLRKKLTEKQKQEFAEHLKDYKEALSSEGIKFVRIMRKCYETEFPFKINFEKPSLAENLIIFLDYKDTRKSIE